MMARKKKLFPFKRREKGQKIENKLIKLLSDEWGNILLEKARFNQFLLDIEGGGEIVTNLMTLQ